MDIFKKEVDLVNSIDFFMENYAPFASKISFHQRRFVILDYSINDTEFTVKINYDKEEFDHLIFQYVSEMTKAIKENKGLNDAGWDSSTVLTEEHEVSEYFRCCVFLSVKTY